MASGLFANAKELGLTTGMNLSSGQVDIVVIDTNILDPDLATDQFYSDISSAVIDSPVTLTSKTVTGGVFDAADPTFSSLTAGTYEALVIFVNTGTPATSPLIAKLTSDTVSGLPITADGTDATVSFSDGANKIFKLSTRLFANAAELALTTGMNLSAGTVKLAIVDTDIVDPNISTHDFYDDISSAVIGTPVALTNKSVTDGIFNADDSTQTSVTAGTYEKLVIWVDTGTPSTSPLILPLSSTDSADLPVTADGGNIVSAFDTGANKIFAL